MQGQAGASRRPFGWGGLIGLLVAFALVPSFVDVFVFDGSAEPRYPDARSVVALIVSHAVGVLIVALVVTRLRWWPAVLHERLRTRRWVWIVPGSLALVSLALADYTRAGRAGLWLTAGLLAGTLLIAVGEELLFRGLVLTFLRDRYREVWAALASSVLFGVFHFLAGPVQVVMSILFGYLLYLSRRVSGGLAVPIAVHALWDFAVFTSFLTEDPDTASSASVALALLTFALILVVLVGARRISPPAGGSGLGEPPPHVERARRDSNP